MASPHSLRISPETQSGPTDLFLPIALILFLIFLMFMVKGSPMFSPCMLGILSALLNTIE